MNSSRLLCLLLCSLGVSACSSLPSWMGGDEKAKPRLEGERYSALPVDALLQPDAGLKGRAPVLPPVNDNPDWAQHGGGFTAAGSNLGGVGTFERITSAPAGDGNAFEHTLVVQPVVAGGMVFTMDEVGKVSARDAADISTLRWESNGVSEEDEPDIIGGGLAYDDGKLYIASGRGMVVVLEAQTGKEIWRKSVHAPFRSAPKLAAGNVLITTIDNQTYALKATDGSIVWSHRGISETSGLLNAVSPAVAGDAVVIPYSSGEVYVLSAANGSEIWSDSLSSGKRSQAGDLFAGIGGDPVVDDRVVITVTGGGMIAVSALANGQRAWDSPIGSLNTPWVSGESLFLLTTENTLVHFSKFDGRVYWSLKLPSFEDEVKKKDPIVWRGPVLVNGKLAVVSSKGQLVMVSATDGTIAATLEVPGDIYTSPVVAGGRMYLVSKDATLYELQ